MLGARRGWGAGPALPPTAPGRGERQRTRKTRVPGLRAHVPRAVASCTANVAEDGGDPGSADTGRPAPGVRRLSPGLPARPAGEALRLKVCRPLGQAPSVLPVRGGGPSLAGGTKPALGRALEPPRAPVGPHPMGASGPRERGARRKQPTCGVLGARLARSGWDWSWLGPRPGPQLASCFRSSLCCGLGLGTDVRRSLPGGCFRVGVGSEAVEGRKGPGRWGAEKVSACAPEGRRLPSHPEASTDTASPRRHPEGGGQVKRAPPQTDRPTRRGRDAPPPAPHRQRRVVCRTGLSPKLKGN